MTHLPRFDPDEVASNAAVASVRSELKADIASVRSDLRTDIASVRSELKADIVANREAIDAVRSDIAKLNTNLIGGLIVIVAAMIGILFAAL